MKCVKEDRRDAGPPKYTDPFLGPITTTFMNGNYPIEDHYSMPRDFK